MTTVDRPTRRLPWVALGVVYVLWGSTYLANRYIIVSMPPLLASGFRFLTGGLLLGLLVLVVAGARTFALTRAELGTAALSGLLLPAWGNGLVILAQSQVASGLAALLIASVPLYIAVLRALTGDTPRARPARAAPGGGRRSCCSPGWAGRRAPSRAPASPCRRTRSHWPRSSS